MHIDLYHVRMTWISMLDIEIVYFGCHNYTVSLETLVVMVEFSQSKSRARIKAFNCVR